MMTWSDFVPYISTGFGFLATILTYFLTFFLIICCAAMLALFICVIQNVTGAVIDTMAIRKNERKTRRKLSKILKVKKAGKHYATNHK